MGIIKNIGKGVGKVVKPFVNFPQWMGLNELTSTAKNIAKLGKDVLTNSNSPKHNETFEQAVKRLELSEQQIAQKQKSFFLLSLFYFAIALMIVIYAVYLLTNNHILASLIAFALAYVAILFAYREHFWYFQMKQRKLGCTFKEWLKSIAGG